MSEPIIIKTPQPVTEERLVLVPPGTVSPTYGERGTVLTIHTDDARDATPDDLERAGWVPSVGDGSFAAVCDVIQRAHRVMHTEPGSDLVRECARVWREGREAVERAEKAERERDEAAARADEAESLRDQVQRDATDLRAEVARLTAPGEGSEGEPTDNDLRDVWGPESTMANARRAIYRLGVAHERARQPEKGRATDEELGRVFGEAYTVEESPDHGVALRTAYLAVAAHVRQERCLVAEAVAMRAGVTISRTSERVPGTTGMWDVYVTRRPDVPGEHYAYSVPTADVPATLARLLGEVAK